MASQERKYAALSGASAAVWARRQEILDANCLDVDYGAAKGLSPAMMGRLRLDENRIRSIVDGLRTVAEPVSYTHLDVYKRQKRHCGNR